MAEGILRMLSEPTKAQEMGSEGRHDVETRFTTRLLCDRLRGVVEGQ